MLKLIHAIDMPVKAVIEYYNSFENKKDDLNCYEISLIADDINEYFRYISNNYYETDIYYLVDDRKPNYIIGFSSIEDSIFLNYHKDYLNVGNIGYGIRPNERNKGYGTLILKLTLIECAEKGMHEVCISCLENNTASKKIIENNEGKFKTKFWDEDTGRFGLKYWIKLHPNIKDKSKRYAKKLAEMVNDAINEIF